MNISAYILRRIFPSLLTMLCMVVVVFAGIYALGNPRDLYCSPDTPQVICDKAAEAGGWDLPLHQQFGRFVKDVAKGNLGTSFVHDISATQLIFDRLPATLELAIFALLLAILIGIPLGMLAGLRPQSATGKGIMTGSVLGFSLPTFWVGLMLIFVFSVSLKWFPAGGRGETVQVFGISLSFLTRDGLMHLLLPAVNLALFKIALVIRLSRAGTLEVVHQDYIKFARAKGLSSKRIVFLHMLKNILIPIITVLGIEFGSLIAFSVVTETVFRWPGIGSLLIQSIAKLDRPVVVAYLLLVVFMFILINLVVDIIYSVLDPRVRLGGRSS